MGVCAVRCPAFLCYACVSVAAMVWPLRKKTTDLTCRVLLLPAVNAASNVLAAAIRACSIHLDVWGCFDCANDQSRGAFKREP